MQYQNPSRLWFSIEFDIPIAWSRDRVTGAVTILGKWILRAGVFGLEGVVCDSSVLSSACTFQSLNTWISGTKQRLKCTIKEVSNLDTNQVVYRRFGAPSIRHMSLRRRDFNLIFFHYPLMEARVVPN